MTGISEDRGLSHVLDSVGIVLRKAVLQNCVEEAETVSVNW